MGNETIQYGTALVLLGPLAMARWAWGPAFVAGLVVLPWRGWRGVAMFGGVGAALLAVAGVLTFGAEAPLNQVLYLLGATAVVAGVEAIRANRWRSMLLDPITGLPFTLTEKL